MIAPIAKALPLLQELQRLGINDTQVLDVMSQIPRELFLPPTLTHKAWEKPHQENLTGTVAAYAPQGSIRRNTPAPKSDYEAWSPE